MYHKLVLLSVILILGLANISFVVASSFAELQTFSNNFIGIKMEYPDTWSPSNPSTDQLKCINKDSCIIIFKNELTDDTHTSFSIYVQKSSEFKNECKCETLIEYVQFEYKNKLEKNKTFSLVSDSQTTVNEGKTDAWQIEYTTVSKKQNIHHFITWVINNDIFYKFSFHSKDLFNELLPEIQNMIQSIKFSSPQNVPLPEEKSSDFTSEKKIPSFMNTNTSIDNTNITSDTKEKIDTEILNDMKEQENNSSQVIGLSNDVKKNNTLIFDDTNIDTYFQSPDSNVGKKATITGLVSNIFPPKSGIEGFQLFHKGDQDKVVIIYSIKEIEQSIEEGDCIKLDGVTGQRIDYQSLSDGYKSAPGILLNSIEKIICLDTIDPNADIITIEQDIEKSGIIVTLHKIEVNDKDTKVFLTIKNTNEDNDDTLSFNDISDSKASQGKKKYEAKHSSKYSVITSEIPPNTEAKGIVLFEPINLNQDTKFTFKIDKDSDDYKFNFNIDKNDFSNINNQEGENKLFGNNFDFSNINNQEGENKLTEPSVELLEHKIKKGKKFLPDGLVGEVKNSLDRTIRGVEVIATFYDDNGDILGTRSAYTIPATMESQSTAPFNIALYNDEGDDAEKYDIKIQWGYTGTSYNQFLRYIVI
ncbi:MAG: FxLYD domain-containing protein [Nitrososphaeraceae archaeon]